MNDFKEILFIIGCSFGRFFQNLAAHLALLFLSVLITLPLYFFTYKLAGNHWFFVACWCLWMIVLFVLRKILFFRFQVVLNVQYIRFLENRGALPATFTPEDNCTLKETLHKARTTINETGHQWLTMKLVGAITALIFTGYDSWTPTILKQSKKIMQRYAGGQLLAVFLVCVPYALISFLFTMGVSGHLQFLVFVLGFFFVYFIDMAIIDPFVSLLVLKRLYVLCE